VAFNGGGQIGDDPTTPTGVNFANLGGVTIGNDAGDEFTVVGNLGSTAGSTALAGTVRTNTGSMAFDTVSLLASTTLDSSDGGTEGAGGSINFSGNLNGAHALTLIAGTGNIRFQGNVKIASVEVESANDVNIDDSFATSGPAMFRYSGNLEMPESAALDVASMSVDKSARGAKLFGSVNGKAGDEAALEVAGPVGDADFTINGCVIGVSCEPPDPIDDELLDPPSIPPQVESNVPGLKDPVANELYVIEPPQLLTFFDARQPSSDPRDSQYSNFGNEELWDQSE
jgi:hypothetical protein